MTDRKVAVVTGAAKGIGRATVQALAARSWNVVLLDTDEAGLRDAKAACAAAGVDAVAATCRIDDDAAVDEIFRTKVMPFGRCDLVVNCAGVGHYAPFMELTAQNWRDMINVNLLGTVFVSRAAMPLMKQRGEGHIIMMGSQRGTEPTPETSAYSASKAAIHILAKSVGTDVGRFGVKVTVICPGGVKTAFRNIPVANKDERFLEPEDIASMIIDVVETSRGTWVRELTILPLGV